MNGVSIIFLVVMILVGGLVAYIGDLLGRRLGKKRLSVWRLRPKHTAALGTFLAGMLGTLVTIIVLATASEPVRAWLLEGEQIRRDLKAERQKLSEAQETLQQERDRISQLEDRNKQLSGENEARQTELTQKEADILKAQQKAQSLESQIAGLQAGLKDFRKRLADARTQVIDLEKRQKELLADVKTAEALKAKAQTDNAEIQRVNLELTNQNSVLERKIAEAEAKVKQLSMAVEDYQKLINQQESQLEAADRKYQDAIREATANLAKADNELKALQDDINRLKSTRQYLETTIGFARTSPLLFNRGAELARLQTRDLLTMAEAEKIVLGLLSDSNDLARDAGSSRAINNRYATLVDRQIETQTFTPEEQIKIAVEELSGKSENMLVIARVLYNAFKGEPVALTLEVHRNPVIYEADAVVFEFEVDGRQTENEIISSILASLRSGLSDKASGDGMIPAYGQESPLGEVTQDQILEMAERVKAMGRRTTVQILAAQQTRAGDKLKVKFRLKP